MAKNGIFLVLCQNDTYVGTIASEESGKNVAHIVTVAVDPLERGKGYGDLLLRGFEAFALQRGFKKVLLDVHYRNKSAISLYRKHGYKQVAKHVDYYADGEHALVMKKVIAR